MAFQYRPRSNSNEFLVTVYKPKPASCSQSIGKSYRGSLQSVVDNGLTGCFHDVHCYVFNSHKFIYIQLSQKNILNN